MKKNDTIIEKELLPSSVEKELFYYDNCWRVKVFELNPDNTWTDCGTGLASIIQQNDVYYIHVTSETDKEELVNSKITEAGNYERQKDTIITWYEEDKAREMALSFQDVEDTKKMLEILLTIQGRDPVMAMENDESIEEDPLPLPALDNLAIIGEEFSATSLCFPIKRARLTQCCLKDNFKYLNEIINVFHEAEKQEFTDRLTLSFYIMKGVIGLNCQRIIEYLLSDPLYLDTFGILEYDPDINISKAKYKYRAFLKERVSFVNTANVQDPEILDRIHLNFRLIFLRDTASARWIEEGTYELLMTMINTNYEAILRYIYENESSLEEIMRGLSDAHIDTKLSTVRFIIDLFNNSKQLLLESKQEFFSQLVKPELLSLLTDILTYKEGPMQNFLTGIKGEAGPTQVQEMAAKDIAMAELPETKKEAEESKGLVIEGEEGMFEEYEINKLELLKIHVAEILTGCLQILPKTVKATLLSEEQKKRQYTMLSQLVSLFLYSPFDGMKLEICEFLKGLLDPESRELKDEFFDLFYGKILPQLVDYLSAPKDCLTTSSVLELLTICGNTHGYRIRYFVTHNGVLQRIQHLFSSPQKALKLSALRLLRSLISHNDENLNKYVIKHDLFAPLFRLLQLNKRDNLLSSALLDILNVVAAQSMRTLIAYIMEKYKTVVTEGKYAKHPIMRKIKTKYELFPPPDRPIKRELPIGKRAFLNYPAKEETKREEEGKAKTGLELGKEEEQKIQFSQKRPLTEDIEMVKEEISEEKIKESPPKKKKVAEDPEIS